MSTAARTPQNKVYVRNGMERIFTANQLRTMGVNKPETFGWVEKNIAVSAMKPSQVKAPQPKKSSDFKSGSIDQVKAHLRAQPKEAVIKFFEGETREAMLSLKEEVLASHE